MNILLIAILIIFGVIIFWVISSFNRLIVLKNRAKEAWSDIDVQLKRRYDLIPNLLETVKGYATHEREVLENVTKARSVAMGAQTTQDRAQSEDMLSSALKSLFAVSENYPALKASENFIELQRELTDTEDKIQAARRFYNTNVRDMNILIETVPSNIIANMFGFKQMEFFELKEEAAKEPVKIKF